MMADEVVQLAEEVIVKGRQLIECPLCMDNRHLLKTLICGHSVCEGCEHKLDRLPCRPKGLWKRVLQALRLKNGTKNRIKCPSCEKITTTPPDGRLSRHYLLADISSHFDAALGRLIQLLSVEPPAPRHQCGKCGQCELLASDTVQCHDCQKNLLLCCRCALVDGHSGHRWKFLSTSSFEEEENESPQTMDEEMAKLTKEVIVEGQRWMECSLCMDNQPLKTLACGHSLCELCEHNLPHYLSKSTENTLRIRCPWCKSVTQTSSVGLRCNYAVISVISHLGEALQRFNQLSLERRHKCGQCQRRGMASDTVQCQDCPNRPLLCCRCALVDGHSGHQWQFLATVFEQERQRPLRAIGDLPDEPLVRIFRSLPVKNIVASHQVCRRWHQVISDHCNQLPKAPIDQKQLVISWNHLKYCVQVRFGHRCPPFNLLFADLPTLAKRLQHFRVSSIVLHLSDADFHAEALSIVVDQLLQPSLSSQVTSISFHSVKIPVLVPFMKKLLQGSGCQLRKLFTELHAHSVMPLVNDQLILSAGTEQLTDLAICSIDSLQCNVTDDIFSVINVHGKSLSVLLANCPLLTLNGLRRFLQRWMDAAGSSRRHSSPGKLQLFNCSQLTAVAVEDLCYEKLQLPTVTVVTNSCCEELYRNITLITNSSQKRSLNLDVYG